MESPMDAYFRNLNDVMDRHLEIERRFDDMMDKMRNMLKGVTEQSYRGGRDTRCGRDNRGGRGNRGGTNVVKHTSTELFSVYCGDHHYYDCPNLWQKIGSLRGTSPKDDQVNVNIPEKIVETTVEIANTQEDELEGDDYERMVEDNNPNFMENLEEVVEAKLVDVVQESIVEEAITEETEKVVEKIEADGAVGPTSPTTCSSSISSSLQVHEDHPLEERTGLSDIPTPTNTFPMDVLVPVDIDGKPKHNFIDPFVVYCAVIPASNPYDYVVAPEKIICIEHSRHSYALVSLVRYSSSARGSSSLKPSLRLVFDPGISLVFVAGSSCCVLVAAFYDILLIRGRILSNREGMM